MEMQQTILGRQVAKSFKSKQIKQKQNKNKNKTKTKQKRTTSLLLSSLILFLPIHQEEAILVIHPKLFPLHCVDLKINNATI